MIGGSYANPEDESGVANWFASLLTDQADRCERLESPLYAQLLRRLARDAEARGATLGVLTGHETDRKRTALALRLMGALHRLVLSGRAPELARHYPSAGGDGDGEAAWKEMRVWRLICVTSLGWTCRRRLVSLHNMRFGSSMLGNHDDDSGSASSCREEPPQSPLVGPPVARDSPAELCSAVPPRITARSAKGSHGNDTEAIAE